MALTKKQREQLFNKYGGRCAYCGCELQKIWHADHIKPIIREFEFVKKGKYHVPKCTGGIENPDLDNFENLNPACMECNLHKSSGTVEHFRAKLSEKIPQLERYSKDFRFARKFGQVELTPSPIFFYFEIYNRN
jgi:5-methylcytosine-specific restriction endonuclease McrA